MAYVQIKAWDVAELLGLELICSTIDDNGYETYEYDFHGKKIELSDDDYHSYCREEADEFVAQELLTQLGRHLAKIID
jgi:hypothetical protein